MAFDFTGDCRLSAQTVFRWLLYTSVCSSRLTLSTLASLIQRQAQLVVEHTILSLLVLLAQSPGLNSFAARDGWQAEDSEVLIEGCLFKGCYASKKGGAVNQDEGQMSILGSVFYSNVAGTNNVAGSECCVLNLLFTSS